MRTGENATDAGSRNYESFCYSYSTLTAPDGKRVTLRLGLISTKDATEIDGHIEALRSARKYNTRIPDATAVWLKGADKKLVDSLVRYGLCEPVEDAFVVEYFEAYVAQKKISWAERTLINFEQLTQLRKTTSKATQHLAEQSSIEA